MPNRSIKQTRQQLTAAETQRDELIKALAEKKDE